MIRLDKARVMASAVDRKMTLDDLSTLIEDVDSGLAVRDAEGLKALARRLHSPMASLIEEECELDGGIKVCRSDEGFTRTSERAGQKYYTYQHLATTSAAPELMALRVTVHGSGRNPPSLNGGHNSKELIFVLKGQIKMDWEAESQERSTVLDVGDSVFLNPGISHSFTSVDGNDAELIAINYK